MDLCPVIVSFLFSLEFRIFVLRIPKLRIISCRSAQNLCVWLFQTMVLHLLKVLQVMTRSLTVDLAAAFSSGLGKALLPRCMERRQEVHRTPAL